MCSIHTHYARLTHKALPNACGTDNTVGLKSQMGVRSDRSWAHGITMSLSCVFIIAASLDLGLAFIENIGR